MRIKPGFFNKGEVDCGIHGDWLDRYRVSIRRSGTSYEVYRHHFFSGENEVICGGSLLDCVEYCNAEFSYKDVVDDVAKEA